LRTIFVLLKNKTKFNENLASGVSKWNLKFIFF
jgi:hypothetical protein